MRLRCLFLVAILGYEAAAKCVSDDCFRALQEAPTSLKHHCESFLGVTVETATRTTLSTILVTATSKTAGISNQSISDSREGSSQPLHEHEVVDGSVETISQDGLVTTKPSTIPAYASVCSSSQAYASACFCLGIVASSSAPRISSRVVVAVSQTETASLDSRSGLSETSTRYNSSQLRDATGTIFTNATAPLFSNTTSSGRFTNATSAPTPTATSDDPCGGQVSDPFAVRVAQPDGMFDGWFLQLSAAAIIFAPTKESATRFGIASEGGAGGGGHLCTQGQGRVGSQPLVAVAENGTDVTGGAVYFIDAQTLAAVGRLGYAPLRCAVAAEELACAEGAKEFWVACGLGLEITSDGDGVAEIGGWNCTAVALSPVYS